VNNTI